MLRLAAFTLLINFAAFTHSNETISICYEEWTPYAYTENGQPTGTVINQITNKLNNSSTQIIFYEYPYERCVQSLKKGHMDFALFVDEADELPMFKHAIATWDLAVASHNKLKNKTEFESTKVQRVIIARDYEYPNKLLQTLWNTNKEIIKTSYFTTSDQEIRALFNLLDKQQADALVVDKAWATLMKDKLELDFHVSHWTLISVPQFVAYSNKTSSDKLNLMNNILSSLNETLN